MTEGTRQEALATHIDPLADFLAEAIAKLDAMLGGTRAEPDSTPEAEKKPRKRKAAMIVEVNAGDSGFEMKAAA